MAGRIRTTIRKIEQIYRDLDELSSRVSKLIPAAYVRGDDGEMLKLEDLKDPIARAWNELHGATCVAWGEAELLLDQLKRKAGIPQDDPGESEPDEGSASSDSGSEGAECIRDESAACAR